MGISCRTGPTPLALGLFWALNSITQKLGYLNPMDSIQGLGHHRYADSLLIIFSLYFAPCFSGTFSSLTLTCTLDLPFYLFHLVSCTPASSHNIPSTPDPNHDLLLIRRHHLSHIPLDESVRPTLQGISHFSLPTASLMPFLKYSPVRKLPLSLHIPL